MADILIVERGEGADVELRYPIIEVVARYPDTVVVSDAGEPDVNGTYYLAEGTGVKRWNLGGETGKPYISSFGGVYMQLVSNFDFPPYSLYTAYRAPIEHWADPPPETGWEAVVSPEPVPSFVMNYPEPYSETENSDIYADTGIGTAIYVSLFTNRSWSDALVQANEALDNAEDFEDILSAPISLGGMEKIRRAAARRLAWVEADGVGENLTIAVRNPNLGRIEIDISITEPEGIAKRYKYLWDQSEQKVIAEVRNSASLPI